MRIPRRTVAALAATAAATTLVVLATGSPAGAVPRCPATPDFGSSIVEPVQGPATSLVADAVTPVPAVTYATIGGDGKVYNYDTAVSSPGGLVVSPLACLGGGAKDTPAAADLGPYRAFYVLAPNNRIYQKYVRKDGTLNTPWTVVPGSPVAGGPPVAIVGGFGAISLFVRAADGSVRTSAHDPGEPTTEWDPWVDLGGDMVGRPGVATANGAVAVVVRAPNGALYGKVGQSSLNRWGAGWQRLPGATAASPAVTATPGFNRFDIFVAGTTGGLYQSTGSFFGFQLDFSAFVKRDATLPPASRLAATTNGAWWAVHATAPAAGRTVVGLKRYLPGLGWSPFQQAPYTCATCLPETAPTSSTTRIVKQRPVFS